MRITCGLRPACNMSDSPINKNEFCSAARPEKFLNSTAGSKPSTLAEMKRTFFILIFIFLMRILYSQVLIDLGKFPVEQVDGRSISTDSLLQSINWEAIKKKCDTARWHHAYVRKDSLITVYEYVEQGYVSHFPITSYKGL